MQFSLSGHLEKRGTLSLEQETWPFDYPTLFSTGGTTRFRNQAEKNF